VLQHPGGQLITLCLRQRCKLGASHAQYRSSPDLPVKRLDAAGCASDHR
jgi:hypothetical protein